MSSLALLEEVQSLDPSADIFLYEISGYKLDNPSESFKFSNVAGVSFNGPYEAIACAHDAIEISSVGTQPRIQLTVADTLGGVTYLVDSVDGLEGAQLIIRRTKKKFLDGEVFGGGGADSIIQESYLIVARIVEFRPGDAIVVECQQPLDFAGVVGIPSRVCSTKCQWIYRSSYCGYVGSAMYDLSNNPTLNPEEDQCSKTISACKIRFGSDAVLPTSAFPTLQRR
jgi:lambda family phage minor tail protein L